ncbi:DNA repair protein RadA [Desulfotalea psychrophila]|uniref:DNA repair protein RadA n=1 Tax=Desulfotalea psychrophila (strain LSv54 / DSM 12343) TaxID=177439 RepID=Q6AQC5_DESPS|nr:DNA repair protein RadA [Desulfotalea psychrophila]CAG35448.1 probable DNA repair protein (RadA) [Desulfotalea psychrophila LSv54]
MNGKREKSIFICTKCGHNSGKWLGKCPCCGEWQSFVEREHRASKTSVSASQPVPLQRSSEQSLRRLATEIEEFDRVLGGGILPGAMILIGGEPGIGKSTLLLHILSEIACQELPVIYISGEESVGQIEMRAMRLGIFNPLIYLATENRVEAIVEIVREMRPALLVIDSIQTLVSAAISSLPGSINQVRESAVQLQAFAKENNVPVILAGHVTKDGGLAGPKVLEHMVDTVLYFESDRGNGLRILRTVKNRFGSTNEVGVFEMKEEGLVQVANPSEIFLAERPLGEPGSIVLPSMEGTRPILVEVQALVCPSTLAMPRRTAVGADPQRLSLLCAVLEKKVGLDMHRHDIFLNIVGGLHVVEPALDLGVISALASSMLGRVVPPTTLVCGEVGLTGEIRAVGHVVSRIREAERLGFTRFIMPKSNAERLLGQPGIELVGVATVSALLEVLFEG